MVELTLKQTLTMASFNDLQPNDSFINNEIQLKRPTEKPSTVNEASTSELSKENQLTVNGEISLIIEDTSDLLDGCSIGSPDSQITAPPYSPISVDLNNNDRYDYSPTQKIQNSSGPIKLVQSLEDLNISTKLLKSIKTFIDNPNKTQQILLPELLGDQKGDLFIKLEPNCGKKTSYLMGAIENVNVNIKKTQVIITVPNAELVFYTVAFCMEMAKYTKITIGSMIMNEENEDPIEDQILVTTPGLIKKFLEQSKIDLSAIKCLIIDEIELMMSSINYMKKVQSLFYYCRAGQMQIYSHSFDDEHLNIIRKLNISADLKVINLLDRKYLEKFHHFGVYYSNNKTKIQTLISLVKNAIHNKILIYVCLIDIAHSVLECLRSRGYRVIAVTSKSIARDRLMAVHEFNRNEKIVLIVNYPLLQGIELIDLHMIINFDLAKNNRAHKFQYEYFNRISKCTNDGAKPNFVINLINNESLECMCMLEKYFGFESKYLNLQD